MQRILKAAIVQHRMPPCRFVPGMTVVLKRRSGFKEVVGIVEVIRASQQYSAKHNDYVWDWLIRVRTAGKKRAAWWAAAYWEPELNRAGGGPLV